MAGFEVAGEWRWPGLGSALAETGSAGDSGPEAGGAAGGAGAADRTSAGATGGGAHWAAAGALETGV